MDARIVLATREGGGGTWREHPCGQGVTELREAGATEAEVEVRLVEGDGIRLGLQFEEQVEEPTPVKDLRRAAGGAAKIVVPARMRLLSWPVVAQYWAAERPDRFAEPDLSLETAHGYALLLLDRNGDWGMVARNLTEQAEIDAEIEEVAADGGGLVWLVADHGRRRVI